MKLENPPPDPIDRLREFEGYWIIKLNTLEPYGLNRINECERIVTKSGLRNMFDSNWGQVMYFSASNWGEVMCFK